MKKINGLLLKFLKMRYDVKYTIASVHCIYSSSLALLFVPFIKMMQFVEEKNLLRNIGTPFYINLVNRITLFVERLLTYTLSQ